MASLNGFNAADVDPNFSFDAIPAGTYRAVITESEMKPTKNGAGRYLQLTFQVVEGEFKNRLVWARLNLENQSATAVRLANAELSAICRAVGELRPNESIELHNIPLLITVGHKKLEGSDQLTNVIKSYSKDGPAAPPPVASNSKPPWQK